MVQRKITSAGLWDKDKTILMSSRQQTLILSYIRQAPISITLISSAGTDTNITSITCSTDLNIFIIFVLQYLKKIGLINTRDTVVGNFIQMRSRSYARSLQQKDYKNL